METSVDFLNCLDHDLPVKILMCLEDPSDLVRFSCVSRSWRHFVVANSLSKQLCLRMFPCLQRVMRVTEPSCSFNNSLEVGCRNFTESENLEMEHRVYSFLARGCLSFPLRECVSDLISASSTDNYPLESVQNTLEPSDIVARRVPQTVIYKLVADICVINEIRIQSLRANYFQMGSPRYSAKAVRFRMGHAKVPLHDPIGELLDCCLDDFLWTYTSPEFPIAQEHCLQFELPEPVLCVGGILGVELLGIQSQYVNGIFYLRVCHVQAVGRPLSPTFGAEILEPSGKFVLKAHSYTQPSSSEDDPFARPRSFLPGPFPILPAPFPNLEQILNMPRGQGVVVEEYGWNEENVESDEDVEFEFDE